MFPGVFSVPNIKIIIFGSVCAVNENIYTAYFSNILFLYDLCVSSDQFFRVASWQLSVRFYRFVPNDVWYKYDSVCYDLVSASASDIDTCSDFVNGCNNPAVTTGCTRRLPSNTAPWQENNIVGQLKVGPTHRVPTLVPAKNGKSRTSVIIVYYQEWRN
jgi:hypothetical protein